MSLQSHNGWTASKDAAEQSDVLNTRWLIFAPVAILALFVPQANAEPIAGLQTTYYTIDSVPPTRSEQMYTECGSEVENNINRSYDGEPFENCTGDLFMVHMTGFIEIPAHDTIEFWLATDDGGNIDIDGNEWGNWGDQGCSAYESGQIDISAGSQSLDLWMYENGGGTCLMLAWNIDNEGFEIVPDSAFTTNGIPADTTIPDTTISDTTIPDTTVPDTTTTIQETTTTWTTTTTSTTTTTTTSTIAPSTTVPVTTVSTTTTPQTTSTYPPEPTMPEPPVTVLPPQTTEPATPETVPPPPEIELPVVLDPFPQPSPDVVPDPILEVVDTIPLPPDTIALPPDTIVLPPEIESFPPDTLELPPEIVDTILDVVDTMPEPVDTIPDPPDTMPLPPDTMPEPPETFDTLPIELIEELPPELVQALEDASEDVSLTEEQFDMVVESIAELDEEEAVALIEQILATAVTPDQATELASNPDVLAVVTSEQAEEIFETLDVTELDNTQIDALVEAVQSAPVTVRKAFEKTINVFDDGLGDYVPIGSNVPVDTRRTLIAVAAGAATVAAGQRRGK